MVLACGFFQMAGGMKKRVQVRCLLKSAFWGPETSNTWEKLDSGEEENMVEVIGGPSHVQP